MLQCLSKPPQSYLIQLALGLAVASIYARYFQSSSNASQFSFTNLLAFLFGVYVPTYLDGSERRVKSGSRYWPWLVDLIGCKLGRWVLPSMELHFIWEDEKNDPRDLMKKPRRGSNCPIVNPVTKKEFVSERFIFGSHPHGVLSIHHPHYILGSSEPSFFEVSRMENRRDLGADILFRLPVVREMLLWAGTVSADRKVAQQALKKEDMSLMILVGGEAEQLVAKPGMECAFLKDRKGFCRLAVEHNRPVVPIYVFGENDLCDVVDWFAGFRHWLSKACRIAICLPYTYRAGTKLVACFGRPVYPQKLSDADASDTRSEKFGAEVDRLHKCYIDELQRVFEFYKVRLPGYEKRKLEVL